MLVKVNEHERLDALDLERRAAAERQRRALAAIGAAAGANDPHPLGRAWQDYRAAVADLERCVTELESLIWRMRV
jgi:hypothetical protein